MFKPALYNYFNIININVDKYKCFNMTHKLKVIYIYNKHI